MSPYFIRRLLLTIPTIVLVTILIFCLLRLTPGDPVRDQYGERLTPQLYQARKHQLGLDRPLPVQYAIWVRGLLRLDFGRSTRTHEPVKQAVFDRFPATLELTTIAFFAGLAISVVLGTLGGIGLVYPGKRHVFSGPPESAKTLAAYAIALAEVRAGVDSGHDQVGPHFQKAQHGQTDTVRRTAIGHERLAPIVEPRRATADRTVQRDAVSGSAPVPLRDFTGARPCLPKGSPGEEVGTPFTRCPGP